MGVLATGSELLEAGEAGSRQDLRCNGIQNAARLRQLGFAVERTHCSDDPEEIAALQRDYAALWGPLSDLLERLSAVVEL